jgi:hypothetical protein
VAEEVRRELNAVLRLYSRSGFYKERPDLLNKLKQLLEVNSSEAEELAEARSKELSNYSDANMGTKVYAALLSIARGGIYGHAAMLLMMEGALADVVLLTPTSAHDKADRIAKHAARLWIRLTQAGVGGLWVSPAGRIGPPLRFCGT